MLFYSVTSRGDNFRVAFAKLGTLRSILPNSVNVMALTVTATQEILKCVENHLDLKDVVLIGIHSGRLTLSSLSNHQLM